ncbi:type II CRISPR-associated endonuclease Cas1 [Peptoniphilus sp. oral taxon 386]|uniref:type II CRISPR-associated endonuclease Cas1 n=1 Tax=Peptoniphilus sp. oral taxon 386 TaxID=652713 RepID=UPI0001DA9BDC|nr:type II CRISPR-associated endonuclease Cas1 [Peptoniphilus sp. oral taxon 386]EFI42575.1 CRISPR-associated endonuclease Cas1, NMENI subtype [Peptoniphilus sp. oral taxon 386 str. F0131]
MGWRIIKIDSRSKLDYKMNYLVCRKDGETLRIFIDEISVLIVESTSISITAALMVKLIENKIKVVFCDSKRNPSFELMPYYGSHDTSLKIRNQFKWSEFNKQLVWTSIVKNKIKNQMTVLKENKLSEYLLLKEYIENIEFNDETNREGHAAKVYFNALFEREFSRNDDSIINSELDYGYSIILSIVNREISIQGYITQIGIHHNNIFNDFNLGSDLVEPLRIFVDRKVITMNHDCFSRDEKYEIISILTDYVKINNKIYTLNDAIGIYCRSVLEAINEGDISLISYIEDVG